MQHRILFTEKGEPISTHYDATPADIDYAMKRNQRDNPTMFLVIPTGEEYNETLSTEIIARTHRIMKRFGNKLGLPLYDKNFESALKVAITHVLVQQQEQ